MSEKTNQTAAIDESEVVALLNELDELQNQRQILDMGYQSRREEIMRPIAHALAGLEAEIEPQADAINARIAALQAQIESAVLRRGATVRGARLQAVFSRGRVTWDTRALVGYAATHPDVLEFQRVGEPSVAIRPTARENNDGKL